MGCTKDFQQRGSGGGDWLHGLVLRGPRRETGKRVLKMAGRPVVPWQACGQARAKIQGARRAPGTHLPRVLGWWGTGLRWVIMYPPGRFSYAGPVPPASSPGVPPAASGMAVAHLDYDLFPPRVT